MDERPFFERPATKRLIRDLGQRDGINVVAGAGISADSGLPPWPKLIERLLRRLAEDSGLDPPHREDFVKLILSQHGYVTSGSIVQTTMGRGTALEAVRAALYESSAFDPQPGFHAAIIADLAIQQRLDGDETSKLLTTNYDRVLEGALLKRLAQLNRVDLKPGSVVSLPAPIPRDVIPTYHLHGCAAQRWDEQTREEFIGDENVIVIGERDYATLQAGNGTWQDELMSEVLQSGQTSLFTGMSLSDPNMVRYLSLMGAKAPQDSLYALLSHQSERKWVRSLDAGRRSLLRRDAAPPSGPPSCAY